MNRRQLMCGAGGVIVAQATSALDRTRYDLIIKGGRVINPALGLDGVRDIAIAKGRIAAVRPNVSAEAADTLDAGGKLVVPGLIDIHTHAARSMEGPPMVLADGVTGWIDAGTQGADHIADTIAVARSVPQARVLINIGRAGVLPEGDTMDIANADVGALRAAIAAHRDMIVGIKARLSRNVAGGNDFEVLARAQTVAKEFHLPVMIHMGQTVSPLPKLLGLLKKGDIVTHMFAPPPNSIIGEDGNVIPEAWAARRRGVWFDVGNGRNDHLRWDIVGTMTKAGFWPDSFSTDWDASTSRQSGVIDMPNCMSKLFAYGLTLDQAIARGTLNPSRMFPVFRDRGTMNVGAPADIAVLELREGDFDFLDNYGGKSRWHQRLFPSATVFAGKRVAHA